MRSDTELDRALTRYADLVKRLCVVRLKNREDTEDVFQTVFCKYLQSNLSFVDESHEKAWFIRVTLNACNDWKRALLRHHTEPLEVLADCDPLPAQHRTVLQAVLSLPPAYRDAVYLHYYEGYSALEIAALLHSRENTIYSRLSRARALLREQLEGEDV